MVKSKNFESHPQKQIFYQGHYKMQSLKEAEQVTDRSKQDAVMDKSRQVTDRSRTSHG
ncbi:hypothetical protein SESBI_02528 [Sesbania bispinosa]|nr:hypothetical protein SESBI_02528 [Sesbania bispinosa]